MAQITKEEVRKIAQLGRLALTDQEVATATEHIAGILGHFSAIQDIDTVSTPTFDEIGKSKNKTRNDVADQTALTTPEKLLALAPQVQNKQIKVHAVFGHE